MEVKSYSTDKIVKGWQDTVMKPEEMLTFIPPLSDVYEAGKMCERQAEITWDIASKAGERKVVEWIIEHSPMFIAGQDIASDAGNVMKEDVSYYPIVRWLDWQEFLKSLYGRIM